MQSSHDWLDIKVARVFLANRVAVQSQVTFDTRVESHAFCFEKPKVLADTLLLMMFLGLRKLGNICCGHKMFLNKIRIIFCVPDTNFVSATNVAHAGKRGNICVGNNVSTTMCPRLPVPLPHQSVLFTL